MHLGKCVGQVKSDLIFPELLHPSDQVKQARRFDCQALDDLLQYKINSRKLSSSGKRDFLPPLDFLFPGHLDEVSV